MDEKNEDADDDTDQKQKQKQKKKKEKKIERMVVNEYPERHANANKLWPPDLLNEFGSRPWCNKVEFVSIATKAIEVTEEEDLGDERTKKKVAVDDRAFVSSSGDSPGLFLPRKHAWAISETSELELRKYNQKEFFGKRKVEVHKIVSEADDGRNSRLAETQVDLAGHRKPQTKRNFTFEKIEWREMIDRIRQGEKLYMRHTKGAKKRANAFEDFCALSSDDEKDDDDDDNGNENPFKELKKVFMGEQNALSECFHSAVLRVSSPNTTLWMHFDTRDNILHQICGKKRIILYAPKCDPYLNVEGSSARIQFMQGFEKLSEDESFQFIDENESAAYKLFDECRVAHAYVCTLEPGESLEIPALWFHRVTSLPSETNEPSVAINVFYNDRRLLALNSYDAKDVYGNKDLIEGKESVQKAMEIGLKLNALPEPYKTFYARRCLNEIAKQLGTVLDFPNANNNNNNNNNNDEEMKLLSNDDEFMKAFAY